MTALTNSSPPSMRSSSSRRCASSRLCDPGVGRVAGHLLDAEVLVGDARDLRQVGDRQDLRAPGQPLQHAPDAMGRYAAHARVDLVQDERLAARDRRDGERDARQLAAGRGLGDGCEREPSVGPHEEHGLVGPRWPRLRSLMWAKLDSGTPPPPPEVRQLGGRRRRPRTARPRRAGRPRAP